MGMAVNASGFGVLEMVRGTVDVCSVPASELRVDGWMELIGEVSQAMTMLAAARDAAIVRLAAIDEVVTDDGVIDERVNGLGTICLDAGAMVSTATGTSARFGQEMVEQAVTRVVRVPALHEAMLDGRLDDYKARCIADELADVPADLARTVLDALGPQLGEKSGPALRRRTRDLLFSLAPELLKKRIRRARSDVGLRRWTGAPGTDSWGAVFPSERAATAWAAIDALARQYRLDGKYPTLEQARAFALLDLVDGRTTVETVLHLTVAADALDEAADVSAGDSHGPDSEHEDSTADDSGVDDSATERSDPDVRGHVASAADPREQTTDGAVGSGAETFVRTAGARGSDATWMPLSSLAQSGALDGFPPGAPRMVGSGGSWAAPRRNDAGPGARFCDPRTGALLDIGDELASSSYRPGERLKQLIRHRDGRCRFPGCVVPARQCDIDHVIPWPKGRTSATNLICLCRRHHRIKQRHRWRVRLRADGIVEWLDPRGLRQVTEPIDHLGATERRVVLVDTSEPADGTEDVLDDMFDGAFDDELDLSDAADAAADSAAEARLVRHLGSSSMGDEGVESHLDGEGSPAPAAALPRGPSPVSTRWPLPGSSRGLSPESSSRSSHGTRGCRRGIITIADIERLERAGLADLADGHATVDDALDALDAMGARAGPVGSGSTRARRRLRCDVGECRADHRVHHHVEYQFVEHPWLRFKSRRRHRRLTARLARGEPPY